MTNFDLANLPDLLERLSRPLFPPVDPRTDAAYIVAPSADQIEAERAECAAAIRALMVHFNEVGRIVRETVAAEREACAKVCDDRSGTPAIGTRDIDKIVSEERRRCADAIRERGEPSQRGSTRDA